MRAVLLRGHGGVENLVWGEIATPEPGPGQVRVRVRACALNHLDLWVRQGLPTLRVPLPHVLGSDIAGEVDALGAGVDGPAPGTPVLVNPGTSCGRCRDCLAGADNFCREYRILGEHRWGGYAELVVVPAANLAPMPAGMAATDAAALPLVLVTAWQMVVERARLRAGETALVWGAGSGVGSAAVQIAKAIGATVIATVGGADKVARARALGADLVLDHAAADVVAEVRGATGRRGADVVIEHAGAATWERSLHAAARGGRIVTCGATAGHDVPLDLRVVFWRQLQILGSTMGSKGALFSALDLVAAGRVRPVVDSVFPMENAGQAHEKLASRNVFGKVVLAAP